MNADGFTDNFWLPEWFQSVPNTKHMDTYVPVEPLVALTTTKNMPMFPSTVQFSLELTRQATMPSFEERSKP